MRDRLKATADVLHVLGKDPAKIARGFADEVAAQLHSNKARFWSFQPHLARNVNTTRSTKSFFGFYAGRGESCLTWLLAFIKEVYHQLPDDLACRLSLRKVPKGEQFYIKLFEKQTNEL